MGVVMPTRHVTISMADIAALARMVSVVTAMNAKISMNVTMQETTAANTLIVTI